MPKSGYPKERDNDGENTRFHTEMAAAKQAQDLYETELLQRSDVIAVGTGYRTVKGTNTGEICLKAYVVKKMPVDYLLPGQLLPKTLPLQGKELITVDVEEIGPVTSPPLRRAPGITSILPYFGMSNLDLRVRSRPALGGSSVAHYLFPIGTLTIGVRDGHYPGIQYVLSCNHVLSRLNGAFLGDPILQPAAVDGGIYPRDVIASLSRFVPLDFSGTASNLVDAAIAYSPCAVVLPDVNWLGRPLAVRSRKSVHPGDAVLKVGRTTGLTKGIVAAINTTVKVDYSLLGFENMVAIFKEQVLTTAMCAYGDSGSLLVDEKGNAVGLLFGGSLFYTIFNYIDNVQEALDIIIADETI
jgi:hypothetical protein